MCKFGPLFFALFFTVICPPTDALTYNRCGLAKALLKYPNVFTRAQLSNWVCLVEHESSRNTDKIGGPNSNKSYDYGLFQVNSRYWCGMSTAGGDCKILCKSLLGANGLDASANCVKKIYARHGFDAWYGWKNGCRGKTLPDLKKECGI